MKIISDIFWNEIESLIPKKTTKVGRPRKDPRIVLSGIFFIITTGIQWKYLPSEYGKTSTVHHIFRQWVKLGIFDLILKASIKTSIKQLGITGWYFTDTSSSKAQFAQFGGKNPTDRSKNGIKKSLVIDSSRIILSISVGAANTHDSKFFINHLSDISNYLLSSKPSVLTSDSAYDIKRLRKESKKYNIALISATNVRRDKNKIKFKPKGRWRVEQVFGIQNWHRGIKFCWTKTKDSFLAYCQFVAATHNFRLLGIFV